VAVDAVLRGAIQHAGGLHERERFTLASERFADAATVSVGHVLQQHDPQAGGLLDIQVDLALSGSGAVVEVGRAVQRAVSEAVSESTGAEVDSVRVFVLDIEPGRP